MLERRNPDPLVMVTQRQLAETVEEPSTDVSGKWEKWWW
jgi:hypothetical protein